ncbi:SAM-dependent methyltransferase [Arthrobacter sp. R3-55]
MPPLYESLTWLTPLSEERAAHLVAFLSDPAPAEVLDMGCGWGELLLRVLASAPQARGRGVDRASAFMDRATQQASTRGLLERVTQACAVCEAMLNFMWWALRTSIEDGKTGQLELPLRTTANLAPASSQPATGTGAGNDGSSAQDPGSAVIAADGSPPRNSDSEIDDGTAEQPASIAARPATKNRKLVPI